MQSALDTHPRPGMPAHEQAIVPDRQTVDRPQITATGLLDQGQWVTSLDCSDGMVTRLATLTMAGVDGHAPAWQPEDVLEVTSQRWEEDSYPSDHYVRLMLGEQEVAFAFGESEVPFSRIDAEIDYASVRRGRWLRVRHRPRGGNQRALLSRVLRRRAPAASRDPARCWVSATRLNRRQLADAARATRPSTRGRP